MAIGFEETQDVDIQVVGSSKFGINPKINAEKTYNMYMSDGWLVSFPGYQKIANLIPINSDNPRVEGRGFFHSIRGNIVIAVINSSVYRLDELIGAIFIGNLNTSSGRVYIDENLSGQIAIADGLNLYIYNRNINTLTTQTVPSDLIPNYVVYHNTYFLIGNANVTSNGAKWYAYKYDTDNTVIIQYTLALETKPDYAIAVNRLPGKGNNVIVFGTAVSEIQTNIGGLLGYQRLSTMNINYGLLNVDTLASSDTFIIGLFVNECNAPVILVFDGSQIIPISSDGINYVLNSLHNPKKSNGFIFKTDTGHLMYILTFFDPEDNLTLMWDFNTKSFFHLCDHNFDYYQARQVVYINNKSYFISLNNGAIYEISSQFTTFNENPSYNTASFQEHLDYVIPRQRICNSVRKKDSDRFISQRITLTMQQGIDKKHIELANLNKNVNTMITEDDEDIISETGQQLISEQGQNTIIYTPAVDFSFSKDGGVTFSNEKRHLMQYVGKRTNMMRWDNLGTANDFTPKFKFWGKSDFIVGNAVLEIWG